MLGKSENTINPKTPTHRGDSWKEENEKIVGDEKREQIRLRETHCL